VWHEAQAVSLASDIKFSNTGKLQTISFLVSEMLGQLTVIQLERVVSMASAAVDKWFLRIPDIT
jgi:hypothetical protein